MIILDCEQGSPEWTEARRGIPTASEFGRIITPKTGKMAAAANKYMAELIASTVIDGSADWSGGHWTERGIILEPEARDWYAFERDVDIQQIGLALRNDGKAGASPDGLVGDDGGLEIKCPKPSTHVEWLMAGTLPDEHKAQVHGNLLICEREWWDFVSYCPGLRPLVIRVTPDNFTEALSSALDEFIQRLATTKAQIL